MPCPDLTEAEKYAIIIRVGRSKFLLRSTNHDEPPELLRPRAVSLYSRGPIGASW
jgi:hypothetical protein